MTIYCFFKCKGCNEYIGLDNNVVSKNGNRIPLNAIGLNRNKPHSCIGKTSNKQYLNSGYSYFCWCSHGKDQHLLGPCPDGCGTQVIRWCGTRKCPCTMFRPYTTMIKEQLKEI